VLQESMTSTGLSFADLSDDQLLAEVRRPAAAERRATAALIRSLMELDARRLFYLSAGCSSLFTYCTQVLHLAEGAAYNRIEATRAARRFPVIIEARGWLADGRPAARATPDGRQLPGRPSICAPQKQAGDRAAGRFAPSRARRSVVCPQAAGASPRDGQVWRRDEGRCAFVGSDGRCTERGFSSFTTCSRSPQAERRTRRTSSCAAGRTISTKPCRSSKVTRPTSFRRRSRRRRQTRAAPKTTSRVKSCSAVLASRASSRLAGPRESIGRAHQPPDQQSL
jgi:hypothetical protein